MAEQEIPYEEFAPQFEANFTWELDDDTLTLESENGSISTAETKLSKGKTTFTLTNEDSGAELTFTKVK